MPRAAPQLLVGTPSLQAGWQPALSGRCYPKASRPLDGLKLPESNKQKGHKLHVCHVIHFPSEVRISSTPPLVLKQNAEISTQQRGKCTE
jgi:hypothetical protein